MMKIYTHYGADKFDKNLFRYPKTHFATKPAGGFWGSPNDSNFGWNEWNEEQGYGNLNNEKKIRFTLTPSAKVVTIDSEASYNELYKKYKTEKQWWDLNDRLDWDKIFQDYDAMEVYITRYDALYMKMYTWDCDSICVFNPNVIVQVDN